MAWTAEPMSRGQLSHLPLFADLRDRPVLVVGGGQVAARKVELLRRAGALISVVSPVLGNDLAMLARAGTIRWLPGGFSPAQLDGCWLAVAAADDAAVNATVASAARARRLPVNVVDDATASTVIVPAIVDRSPLVVAISTSGAAPVIARRLRAEIETLLDRSWAPLVRLCASWRQRIAAALPSLARRRHFYEQLLEGPVRHLLATGQTQLAEAALQTSLTDSSGQSRSGSVVLVGAGPGDPGLLTLNALRALQGADVILHDQLVSDEILELARRDARRIAVGKQAGGRRTQQRDINRLMVRLARGGQRVVRLKGGDPFIFGRGGEELEHLRAHGVPYEVVPGVTAATACAAYAGVPLTHRDYAQSVRFMTAHCRDSIDTLDWKGLAAEGQTLAIYMGVAHAGLVQARLIALGRKPETPVVVVENGTRPTQRVLSGTLQGLAELVESRQVQSPALLIIGDVAACAERLGWFGQQAQQADVLPQQSATTVRAA